MTIAFEDNRFRRDQSIENLYASGFAHYRGGHWEKAAEIFRILCTQKPFDSRFWFGLAATMQEAHHYDEALPSWAMVALLKPDDPYSHFHAAECYFSLEEHREALKALREVEHRIGEEHSLKSRVSLLKEQWEMKRD